MEHGFPPGATVEDVHAVWLLHHAIMLSLLAVVASVHLLPARRLGQPETLWLCTIILIVIPAVSVWTWASLSHRWVRLGGSRMNQETLAAYLVLYWLVGMAGSIRTLRGTKKIDEYSWFGTFHTCSNTVCPIVGIFAASILIPVMTVRGEAPYRFACANNIRSIGRGLESYFESTNTLPQATIGKPPRSWRIELQPYLYGRSNLADYDPTSPWDSIENLEVSKQWMPHLTCPSSGNSQLRDDNGHCFADFSMLTGPDTFASEFQPRTPSGISDGASNTIAFVEASGLRIIWTEPRDALVGRERLGVNLTGTGDYDSPGIMSGWHTGGAYATFADGSTKFISQDIDPAVLKALTTANGGENLPEQY